MTDALMDLARAIASSPIHSTVVDLLSNVPGLPPMVQTVHLLSIAAVMGSVVLIDLKLLGLALPGQSAAELTRRLMPWMWWALPLLALSGLTFLLARPQRYLSNPVFGLKFALLVPAIVVAYLVQRVAIRSPSSLPAKAVATLSLLLWIGVVMAGRWIAYADYLFPEAFE